MGGSFFDWIAFVSAEAIEGTYRYTPDSARRGRVRSQRSLHK